MSATAFAFGPVPSWETIVRFAKRLGLKGVEAALLAWSVAMDPEVPLKARAKVFAALVYLGMPIDAVPDHLPGVGLTDDAAVLMAAIAAIAWAIGPKHRAFAQEWMQRWKLA